MNPVDIALSSLNRMWKRRQTMLLLVLTIAVLSAAVGLACSMREAMTARTAEQLETARMLDVGPARGAEALDLEVAGWLAQQPEVDTVVPWLTGSVYLEDARGEFKPLLCSSVTPRDPTLEHLPVLEGSTSGWTLGQPALVLAPNVLERLGYPQRGMVGRNLRIRVVCYKPSGEKVADTIACRIAAVLGDLGQGGVRLDLATLAQALLYQSGKLDGLMSRYRSRSVGFGTREAQLSLDEIKTQPAASPGVHSFRRIPISAQSQQSVRQLTWLLGQLDEIHVLRLFVKDPTPEKLAALHASLEATGRFRCESAFYEHGRQHALLGAVARLVTPVVIVLGFVVAWAIILLVGGAIQAERQLICLWRAAGARPRDIFLLYLTLTAWVTLFGTLSGIAIAVSLVSGPGAELSRQFDLELFGEVPVLRTLLVMTALSAASGLIPAIRAARLDIERGLREGNTVG